MTASSHCFAPGYGPSLAPRSVGFETGKRHAELLPGSRAPASQCANRAAKDGVVMCDVLYRYSENVHALAGAALQARCSC